jgi:putative hemolysin
MVSGGQFVRILYLEIAIVLVLTVINGLLAMSELAVVSSRPARLKVLIDQRVSGARRALALGENPGRFLSTVQIGITLVGVLSGAFSGATLGARLTGWLMDLGLSQDVAEALGVGSVVVAITYLSLIVGELVPKQLALGDPERVACRVAPAMTLLAKVASPLVWLLDASGNAVLRLLGRKGKTNDGVSDEEVRTIIAEAESAGVLETEEKEMIGGVMRLADRTAKALMTPRGDVEMLSLRDDPAELRGVIEDTRRSRLPVSADDADEIIGVVFVKDVMAALARQGSVDLRALVHEAPIVTDNARALDVLKSLRASVVHMALVFDEYGHFEGIVTSGDILESIAGEFADADDSEPAFVRRDDGSWLVAGWMPIDEFADKLGGPVDPAADYETVAGLALFTLNRLPEVGERFSVRDWEFEIVDLDGRRIDKLIARRAA